ncbi:hypothetical protein BGZ65_012101 [Modicella reniformis]|uniref:DUF1772-domain-containing protein n=1 Tax=Modicella reniformis TaxID=1440133 RepID=A0A9P6IN20_9FUNG|nr:hypothetical protein BGZ65_012101 [Modicella reniformis]
MGIDFKLQSFANSSNTLLAGKMVTVASIGIFAGTALSFNTIIMPALRKFSSSSSVAIWDETLKVATSVQVSAIVGALGNAALYYKTKNPSYLYSAIALVLTVPYNLLAIYPINKKLFAIRQNNTINGKSNSMKDGAVDDTEANDLLNRWNLFHAGRTIFGFGALFATVYGVASDSGFRFIVYK